MIQNFKAISLSYSNAPITVRELFALQEDSVKHLLNYLRDCIAVSELLILYTCNRTEVYYSSDTDHSDTIIKVLAGHKGISEVKNYLPYFKIINDPFKAVRHLFNVALGLEAQVTGEVQVTNQVKQAYQLSADMDLAGPFLHRLMHSIFYTNKRVVQETQFRDGAASISYVAVELIEELTAKLKDPKILVAGIGVIGADLCRNLAKTDFTGITITNRTISKARDLADECDACLQKLQHRQMDVIPFEQVWDAIKQSDVVISSVDTGSFITKEFINSFDINSHKYLIDLSVPRSIEPDVEGIPGVLLYNLDDLKEKANRAMKKRIKAIPLVQEIISQSISDLVEWNEEMKVSPTIHKLKSALEQIRKEEIIKYIKHLDKDEVKRVEEITKNMMQKIIKFPVLQLKAACKRGEAETLIDMINELFDLEKEKSRLSP
ncbi:MAG: glutamyl-tRNA reductase [Cytophagales bacterium]|nr:glutamyl-tRNA reductase [Cytophagales bacterium]